MPKRQLTAALLLLLSGCAGQAAVDVAVFSGGLRPFDELRGVRLGMTAAEFRRARPTAQLSGYTGMADELSAGRVEYVFPGTSEDAPPSDGARLVKVSAMQTVATDSATLTLWRDTVAEAIRRNGRPTRCDRVTSAVVDGHRALWARDSASLSVNAWIPRGQPASSTERLRTVIVDIASPESWGIRLQSKLESYFVDSALQMQYVREKCP